MSEIILINKMRYLEYGKKAPKGSRFKGIVTLQSLTGLVNYHAREDAKVQREEQNLLNYSSKIRGHHTLTNEGYLDTEQKRELFKNEIGNYFNKDGRICWDTIVSLPSYEVAQKHGLYAANDYTQIVERGLTKFFVNIGLDLNNVIYWIDHHNDTDNPHCHIGFMEKEPTITKGYFSQKKLDQLKKSITNQVLLRKEFAETKRKPHIELLQKKDLLQKNIREVAMDIVKNADEEIATLIKKLYTQLDKKGRWQYNSIHIKEQRPLLDYIVEKVLISNDEIKQKHQQFNEKLLKLDSNLNNATGSKKNTMYEKENEKLKVQIANYILKEMKDYKDLHPPKEKRKILDIIPSSLTRSEDIHGPIPYPNSKIKIYFNDTDVYNNKDLIKKFRLVSNKEYQYIDEDGIGKKETGSEIFSKIQTKLFVQAQNLRTSRYEIIFPNIQLSEDDEDMTKLRFQDNNASVKVESVKVRPVNHLYSLVKLDKERYVVWVHNQVCYVKGRELAERIANGIDFKVRRKDTSNKKELENTSFTDLKMKIQNKEVQDVLKLQSPKRDFVESMQLKESIISKNVAKRISRKGRSLGMSWMNKIENETDQAIQEYLNAPGK